MRALSCHTSSQKCFQEMVVSASRMRIATGCSLNFAGRAGASLQLRSGISNGELLYCVCLALTLLEL